MRGDFSRDTFDPLRNFSRVLMQQGRVQLDADWNEQVGILLHQTRTMCVDLMGPHAGRGDAFLVDVARDEANNPVALTIALHDGHYYVDGILCDNRQAVRLTAQAIHPPPPNPQIELGVDYLVYLDVWERPVTSLEQPQIREVALDGADTSARAQVVSHAKLLKLTAGEAQRDFKANHEDFLTLLTAHGAKRPGTGELAAAARKPQAGGEDVSVMPAENLYRGLENQLYRVEIHRPGGTWAGDPNDNNGKSAAATFKWSRENASVLFPVTNVVAGSTATTTRVILAPLAWGKTVDLAKNDWVELVDDDDVLRGHAEPLLRVIEIDADEMVLTLEGSRTSTTGTNQDAHPALRRWDHGARGAGAGATLSDGAVVVQAGPAGTDTWVKLEQGIEVLFKASAAYQTGDYWLIPARTATGDIEWPRDSVPVPGKPPKLVPRSVLAHGVKHGYAPLAVVSFATPTTLGTNKDMRRKLTTLWT